LQIHLDSIAAIAFFYSMILAVGVWASRRNQAGCNAEAIFLAGRKMSLSAGVFTMTATWVGGGYISGAAEAVYNRGLVWCQAPWGFALSLLLGGLFFAKGMRQKKLVTFLDLFHKKYGKEITGVLFIPALIGEVFWSAAILTALGGAFSTILNLNYETAILLSAVLAMTYTLIGGLWSIAYTDVLQLIFIFIGLSIAVPFALEQVGGSQALITKYQASFPKETRLFPPWSAFSGSNPNWDLEIWSWLDMSCLLIFGGIPWGVYFQRVLSAKDSATAQKLSYYAAVSCLLLALPPCMIGAIGATVDWSTTAAAAPPTGPQVLPFVLQYLVPKWVTILGLGAIAAAVMSSVASSILSGSSMLVWNIYRPLIAPKATDNHIRKALKTSIIAVGVGSTGLSLSIQSVYELWYFCADLVYVLLFPQLVMAMFFKHANKAGAMAGFLVGAILRLGGGEAFLGIPNFIPYPMTLPDAGVLFPFRTFAMLMSMITIAIVSLATRYRTKSNSALSMGPPIDLRTTP